ncbi:MAG: hypothetical protein RDU76_08140 [Candidatus Edwardsbacteria bacterium]|nr:hypothetical protein [Candidatus Edwardsbacteria bacterium]
MNRRIKYQAVMLAISLLMSAACLAVQLEFGGYAKSFLIFQHTPGGSRDRWTLTNPWEFKASYIPQDHLSFNLSYIVSPHWESPMSGIETFYSSRQYRVSDLKSRLIPDSPSAAGNLSLWHNLDRAYVRLSLRWTDIFVGRQPIAWGSARFINPTDVIAPYGFQELDTEDRIGVDAVRINYPLGQLSEVGLGYISGKDFKPQNSATYLRPKVYLLKTDLAFTLMEFKKHRLYGIDISRSLGGAGLWLEAGYIDFEEASEDALRLSAGADYRLSDRIYAFGEYHFNGFGELEASSYIKNCAKQAYSENVVYLMAKNYFTVGLNYQLTPLLNSGTQPIMNIDDRSVVLSQQFDYNLTQNSYLSCGFYTGLGQVPEIILGGGSVIRSEFGSYSDIYFASYRIYF